MIFNNVLLRYFAELPEPLLTYEAYDMVASSSIPVSVHTVLKKLPEINKNCLEYLLAFLIRMSKFSEVLPLCCSHINKSSNIQVNKTSISSLSNVFAPSLLHPKV